jgi:hypothetical protein
LRRNDKSPLGWACKKSERKNMNWKYNDKEYPAVDVRLVECNVTVGSGMRTHDEIHPHRIAILDAEVAAIVLRDNPLP